MFKSLIQFYKIGRDLGLTKNDINRTFLFQNRRSLFISLILIIVISLVAFFLAIAFIANSKNIYPSGTLYSSVSINNFKNKKHELINKIKKVMRLDS